MLIPIIGRLILVVGVSYHLVAASWQVILLSFVAAGVGFGLWKVRKAIIRRAKIKALWRRSIEIDEMLDDDDSYQRRSPQPLPPVASNRPRNCVAMDGPARTPVRDQEAPQGPSPRVFRFSMQELANAREQLKQQPTV